MVLESSSNMEPIAIAEHSPVHTGARVAIIHYWLVGMRGGERVIESLCRIFPDADIYTHVVAKENLSAFLQGQKIKTTFIARLPRAKKMYQSYLPLMPLALEELDLSGYDLVISSEAGPAKGVIVPPGVPHICYCHSPMRYLWDQYHVYKAGAGRLTRLMMPFLAHSLREWDVTSAMRVDAFLANSNHVADRIEKYWRRPSAVVHPPVQVEEFSPVPESELGDFYLWAGELASYKRPDIAIEAFNRMGKKLIVIGGPDKEVKRYAKRAKDNITFLGKVSFEQLKSHMARCKALIFPGEEDFGIVPVEAMASGRPVIAFAKGGALDTVVHGKTGFLFNEQSAEGLISAVSELEKSRGSDINPSDCRAHSTKFNEAAFRNGVIAATEKLGFSSRKHFANGAL